MSKGYGIRDYGRIWAPIEEEVEGMEKGTPGTVIRLEYGWTAVGLPCHGGGYRW